MYVAWGLSLLPKNSLVVYSGPWKGESLVRLIPFLKNHRVILIENYCMEDQDPDLLRQNVSKAQESVDVTFLEKDFAEVWRTLRGVDFLLLDGPLTTFDFSPFADRFIYMMHDTNQRLAREQKLAAFDRFLCKSFDSEAIENIKRADISAAYKKRLLDTLQPMGKEKYGSHSWLIGKKEVIRPNFGSCSSPVWS